MFHHNYIALVLTKYTKLLVFGCEIDKIYCDTVFLLAAGTYNTEYQKKRRKKGQLTARTAFSIAYSPSIMYSRCWACALGN